MKVETTGHLRVYTEGSLIEVISHYTEFKKSASGGGKREQCGGFSKASRKRLMVLLNTLKESALRQCILLTLTYKRNEISKEEDKANFKAFRECLRRNYSEYSGIWKLEYQKRGSPHYHLMLFGGRIPYQWVASTWNRIAEDGCPVHLEAGTRVESARHARCASSYLTKYLGKLGEEGDSVSERSVRTGRRHWGVINRSQLPVSEVQVIPLTGGSAREIIRYECAKRSLGACSESRGAVHLFQTNARDTNQYAEKLIQISND